MAESAPLNAGHIIEHRPSPTFIRETVENVNIGTMTSSSGKSKISVFFTRDELDISHETLVNSKLNPEKLNPVVPEDAVKSIRLQVACLTMSVDTAKSLVRSLERSLKELELSQDE